MEPGKRNSKTAFNLLKRSSDGICKCGIGGNFRCIEGFPQEGDRYLQIRKQASIHRLQNLPQRRLSIFATSRSVEECDRFSGKFSASDDPVQSIFERSGNTVSVL